MRRQLDDLGRICIPADFRKKLKFAKYQPVEVNLHGNTILVESVHEHCALCGKVSSLTTLGKDQYICKSCICRVQKLP